MKKLISVISFFLLAALLMPAIAGVSEAGTVNSQTAITVWFDSNESENEALRVIAERYEAETGVHVNVVARRSVFDAPNDLVNNADVDGGPDIVLMQAPDIGDLAVSGYLVPLELDEDFLNRFADTAFNAFILNGKLYGAGYSIETSGLIYNKDLISEEELPESWEEFFEVAEALTVSDGKGGYTQYGTLLNSSDMWFTYPIIREYGGYYYGRKNDTYNPCDIGLNNDGMLAYVNKMKWAMEKGLVLPTSIQSESHIVAQFAKGNVAMILYGLWSVDTFRNGGIDYGLAKLPAHSDGSPSLPLATVVGFVINAHSKKIAAAEDFLLYMFSDENQQSLIEAGNRYEKKAGLRNPACKAVIESDYIQSDGILASISEIGKECEPFPNIPEGTIWYNYTGKAFKAIFFGGSNPKEKLNELVAAIQSDVEKMNLTPEPVEVQLWVWFLLAVGAALAIVLLVLRIVRKKQAGYFKSYHKGITLLAWALLLPIMALVGMFCVFPIFHNIYISMTDYSGINLNSYNFVGFSNYRQIFEEGLNSLAALMLWTIVFALSVVTISFVLGTWLATILNKKGHHVGRIYELIYILPWVIPTVITLLMWQGLLSDNGTVNRLLSLIGIAPLPFLSNAWLAKLTSILVMSWFGFPYYMVVALGFLQSINKEYYEAASLDGATKGQMFFRITLPIIFRAMIPTLLMGFIMQFNNFGIYMLTQGGPEANSLGAPGATDLLITYVFSLAFNTKRYAMAAAYSVLIFVFVAAFSLTVMHRGNRDLPSKKRPRSIFARMKSQADAQGRRL